MPSLRLTRLLLILLLCVVSASAWWAPLSGPLYAMGFGEEGPDTRIPEPAVSYRVVVRDRELNRFEVVRVTFDGHIYLSGKIGEAKVSIPFDKIRRVDFEPADGAETLGVVTLKSGKQQSLRLRSSAVCYGEAEFGHVQIELRHLRDVEIKGREPLP